MKYLRTFITLTAIILAGSLIEIPAQIYGGDKSPQALALDDASVIEIERAVFKRLIRLPYYGVFDHITYKVEGETVTLFGKVAIARNRKDAERAIKRVAGVRRVANNIEVLPPSPFDDRIRRRIVRTLAAKGLFRYLQEPNPSVRLIVDGGRVDLEGFVANRGDYNLMNILANGVSDVFSVTNNLAVEKEGSR
jgi:hyperosmotically inducible protein